MMEQLLLFAIVFIVLCLMKFTMEDVVVVIYTAQFSEQQVYETLEKLREFHWDHVIVVNNGHIGLDSVGDFDRWFMKLDVTEDQTELSTHAKYVLIIRDVVEFVDHNVFSIAKHVMMLDKSVVNVYFGTRFNHFPRKRVEMDEFLLSYFVEEIPLYAMTSCVFTWTKCLRVGAECSTTAVVEPALILDGKIQIHNGFG